MPYSSKPSDSLLNTGSLLRASQLYDMCGIALALWQQDLPQALSALIWQSLVQAVASRGPDGQHQLERHLSSAHAPATLNAFGATLWMRGDLTLQPMTSPSRDDLLLFNGEIFGGLHVQPGHNDGLALLQHLRRCNGDVKSVLHSIQGPFALVYLSHNKLYYARDRLGRRSLLHHLPDSDLKTFFLGSVWPVGLPQSGHAIEVDAATLYTLDLDNWDQPPSKEFIWEPFVGRALELPEIDLQHHFGELLTEATRKRVLDLRNVASPSTSEARVAVLFSGGLDCATLALLASHVLPPHESIDLINVAFENARTSANGSQGDVFDVPDRQTARASYAELCKLQPARQWNLLHVNVSTVAAQAAHNHVLDLMRPQNTEMDLSLAIALHKAVEGCGVLESTGKPHRSSAKILISGLGADELFGGYSRHRRAFRYAADRGESAQWKALEDEMRMDLERIGCRNLGRDDRCTTVHGKEVRYPFLDEEVIHFVASVPVEIKCDPRLPDGEGDKRFLRQYAAHIGLDAPSTFKKRALQFGSRSAKRQPGLVSGTDAVPYLPA